MATGTLTPTPWQTFLDDDGAPLDGGLVYTYIAGTTTAQPTYTDVGLLVPNANPIVLDAAGRCVMFLLSASYKFVVKRADGTSVRSQDNVGSVALNTASVVGEGFVFGGNVDTPITANAYPSGATVDKLHAGTSIYSVDSANIPAGTYEIEAMLRGAGGGAVTAALVNLDDGADTPLASATSSSTTGERTLSGPITFASPGSVKTYGIKVKVDTGTGYAWGIRLTPIAAGPTPTPPATVLGEVWTFGGNVDTPVVLTAYPSGPTVDKLHAGTSLYNVDSNLIPAGTYEIEAMIRSVGGATVTVAIVDLSNGAPDTPLALCAALSVTGTRVRSGAISFAAPGVAVNYGIKVKIDTGTGYVWGVKLISV